MSLATANAAPLRPEVRLSQALKDFETVLSPEQQLSFKANAAPEPAAVIALTCEIDRQNANRKTRRCGARLTSFLNSVKGFTGVVDTVVGSAGELIAGAIWGAVKIAIQIASALRKPFDDYFSTLQKDLTSLGTEVSEEISLASRQMQISDSREGARERKENSIFRTTGLGFRKDALHELEQARKWRESKAKSRFLEACSTYNHETSLNQARRKGASIWIVQTEEYQQWKTKSSSSILLCSGIVGAGKTVLCASVVEDLHLYRPLHASLAYHFCKEGEAASLKAREILGSLARQMFEDIPAETFSQMSPHRMGGAFDIHQIRSYIELLLPHNRPHILVVDGLYECEDSEAKLIIRTLTLLLKSTKHVFKLFWTGRSDHIEASEYLQSDFQVQISFSNNRQAISNFIEFALEDALQNHRLTLRDPNIVLKIRDTLTEGAREMFLWVVFQIDSLCSQNTDRDILKCLENLPKGLPDTYRRMLRRLRHSSTDASIGKMIFMIAAAAQRSLTLDELAEAISITPGDTRWDKTQLVNNVLKSLQNCGSFIVVDEELSTVHFAHSSVKRHLLSEPSDLDVGNYHFNTVEADLFLGEVAVTYLCLDVLSAQLIKPSQAFKGRTAEVPKLVIKSALPKNGTVSKIALSLLKGRRKPECDSGSELNRSISLSQDTATPMSEVFWFLGYCKDYWLFHTKYIEASRVSVIYHLWVCMISGKVGTVELPWAPDRHIDVGERQLDWIEENPHTAIINSTLERLYDRWTVDVNDRSGLDRALALQNMETLLNLLPDTNGRDFSHVKRSGYKDALLLEAAKGGLESVTRMALQGGADVNSRCSNSETPLIAALYGGKMTLVELLVEKGADVNAENPLQVAATAGDETVVRFLLEKGARHLDEALITAAAAGNIAGGNVACIKALQHAGANVNFWLDDNTYAPTALIAAVRNSNMLAVDFLIDAGADINVYDEVERKTPLQWAVVQRHEEIVKRLLYAGASIRYRPQDWSDREGLHERIWRD